MQLYSLKYIFNPQRHVRQQMLFVLMYVKQELENCLYHNILACCIWNHNL